MKKILGSIGISIALIGPGCGGTDVGNPEMYSDGAPWISSGAPLPATGKILTAICNKLTSCDASLVRDTCLTGVKESSGWEGALGIETQTFANFEAILAAESSGSLLSSSSATTSCVLAIENLACDSSVITQTYTAGSNTWNQASRILSASSDCSLVF